MLKKLTMKLFKILLMLETGSVFLVASCNSGEEKKETPPVTDTSATKKAMPPAKPANVLVIKHKVANYAKWLVLYESHD